MHTDKVKSVIQNHMEDTSDYTDRFKHRTELKRVTVNAKEAAFFLQNNFDKNRTVSKGKIREYVSKIKRNEFNFNAVTLGFCVLPDDRHILVNGQHCSFAIMEANVSVELDIKYHYVNDMEDVKNYYTTYDIGRTRNMNDRISAIGLFEAIVFKRNPDKNVVAGACKAIIKGFRHCGAHNLNAQNPQIVSDLSEKYADAINIALSIKGICELDMIKRFLNRPTTFGAMILTLDMENNDEARDFWSRISTGDMGKKGEPVHALVRSILDGKFMKKQVYDSGSYNVVAKVWNNHLQGKDMINILTPKSNEPIKLFL